MKPPLRDCTAAAPRVFGYGVVDLDRGDVARVFVTDLLGEIERDGLITVRSLGTIAEAERMTAEGVIDAAFVLPVGFSEAVRGQTPATIDVIGNVDSPTGTDIARSIA